MLLLIPPSAGVCAAQPDQRVSWLHDSFQTMTIKKTRHNILPPDVSVRNHFQPGDIGYLVYLHGVLYSKECGWDYTFEAYVAEPLAEFAKSHTQREQIWIVEKDKRIVGFHRHRSCI